MEGSGKLWEALGSSGMLWEALGGSGKLWEALGGSGRLWEALGGTGRLWEALGSSGKLWGALWEDSAGLWEDSAGLTPRFRVLSFSMRIRAVPSGSAGMASAIHCISVSPAERGAKHNLNHSPEGNRQAKRRYISEGEPPPVRGWVTAQAGLVAI